MPVVTHTPHSTKLKWNCHTPASQFATKPTQVGQGYPFTDPKLWHTPLCLPAASSNSLQWRSKAWTLNPFCLPSSWTATLQPANPSLVFSSKNDWSSKLIPNFTSVDTSFLIYCLSVFLCSVSDWTRGEFMKAWKNVEINIWKTHTHTGNQEAKRKTSTR